jgi:hypothetical protein
MRKHAKKCVIYFAKRSENHVKRFAFRFHFHVREKKNYAKKGHPTVYICHPGMMFFRIFHTSVVMIFPEKILFIDGTKFTYFNGNKGQNLGS